MQGIATSAIGGIHRIANRIAQVRGIRLFSKPLYRYWFSRPHDGGNRYYGRYDNFAQAKQQAPRTLPPDFNTPAAAQQYETFLGHVRLSDYPVMFWLSRLMTQGARQVFDLGGHIGVVYYAFRAYVDYPADLRWVVHDLPAVIAAGRARALAKDPERRLTFTDTREDVNGSDLLITNGTLQYLDYSLVELLQNLSLPPTHVLINRVPMHPIRSYFTLQNMGFAICPYRVSALPDFIAAMETLGYSLIDHWKLRERELHVPFEPSCSIDSYHGLYFRRTSTGPREKN